MPGFLQTDLPIIAAPMAGGPLNSRTRERRRQRRRLRVRGWRLQDPGSPS